MAVAGGMVLLCCKRGRFTSAVVRTTKIAGSPPQAVALPVDITFSTCAAFRRSFCPTVLEPTLQRVAGR